MKQDKRLVFGMAFLFLICFVAFGVIILTEKMAPYYIPQIDRKLNSYISNKYSAILKDVKISNTKYDKTRYYLTVSNKKNSHLYFRVYYSNKKITDTYKSDYLMGKTLLGYFETKTRNDIKKLAQIQGKISFNNSLDDFTSTLYQTILDSTSIVGLKIYNIELDFSVNLFTCDEISSNIIDIYTNLVKSGITPKSFTFVITKKDDITKAVQINNITENIIKNSSFYQMIDDIMNKRESNLLENNNITYKYLN